MYIYAVIIIHNGRFRFLPSMCRLNDNQMCFYYLIKHIKSKFSWRVVFSVTTFCPKVLDIINVYFKCNMFMAKILETIVDITSRTLKKKWQEICT